MSTARKRRRAAASRRKNTSDPATTRKTKLGRSKSYKGLKLHGSGARRKKKK